MATKIPEPPNGTVVVIQHGHDCQAITRSDEAAAAGSYDDQRWFPAHADSDPLDAAPRSWGEWCSDADAVFALGQRLDEPPA